MALPRKSSRKSTGIENSAEADVTSQSDASTGTDTSDDAGAGEGTDDTGNSEVTNGNTDGEGSSVEADTAARAEGATDAGSKVEPSVSSLRTDPRRFGTLIVSKVMKNVPMPEPGRRAGTEIDLTVLEEVGDYIEVKNRSEPTIRRLLREYEDKNPGVKLLCKEKRDVDGTIGIWLKELPKPEQAAAKQAAE